MARIYKRGKVWYLDYIEDGQRVRKRVSEKKAIAEKALHDVQYRIDTKAAGLRVDKVPLAEVTERWLAHVELHTRSTTHERYAGVVATFLEFIQEETAVRLIEEVSPAIVEAYKMRRAAVIAKRTVNNELNYLSSLFKWAASMGFRTQDPLRQVKRLKPEPKRPRFFSHDEIRRLLDAADDFERPRYRFFLYTGVRRGELVNLEWEDLDFPAGLIRIRAKDFWQPKSRPREIPLHPELAKELEEMPRASERWVFPRPDGKQLDHARRRLLRVLKRAGIEAANVHTFRHTFASHLVMAGVDLATVAKLLGHRSIKTTMIYAHLAPDHLRRAVQMLNL